MIEYSVAGSGSDWTYTYTLDGFSLTANELVAIYFDYNTVTALGTNSASSTDWTLLTFARPGHSGGRRGGRDCAGG